MTRAGAFMTGAALTAAAFMGLSLMPGPGPVNAMTLDRVVAVVNSEVITWSELYRFMEIELGAKAAKMTGEEKLELFNSRLKQFLEALVEKELQLQQAEKRHLIASEGEIKEAIQKVKNKFRLDEESFKKSLRDEEMTLDDYKSRLAEQIVLGKLVSIEVSSRIVVTDAEVESYIKEKGLNIADLSGYRLLQISFKKPKDPSGKGAVEARARRALGRIRSGEDFAGIARELSEDALAASGGDLGIVKRSVLAREFTDALDKMSPADVSEPFWTDMGLHIVKLMERSGPTNTGEFAASVKRKIQEERFSFRYANWLRELRDNAYIEIKL